MNLMVKTIQQGMMSLTTGSWAFVVVMNWVAASFKFLAFAKYMYHISVRTGHHSLSSLSPECRAIVSTKILVGQTKGLILHEETNERNEADTVGLPLHVAICDREGL